MEVIVEKLMTINGYTIEKRNNKRFIYDEKRGRYVFYDNFSKKLKQLGIYDQYIEEKTRINAEKQKERTRKASLEYYHKHKDEINKRLKENGYKAQYKYIKEHQDYYNKKSAECRRNRKKKEDDDQ